MARYRSIVVASDFSEGSNAAVAQAIRLARADGASLRAIHVIRSGAGGELRGMVPDAVSSVEDYLKEQAELRLREVLDAAGAPEGTEVTAAIGRPGAELVKRTADADLLVLGAMGEGHTRFGTIAGHCVRHAECPTMLVHAEHTEPFRKVVVGVDFSERSARDGGRVTAVHVHELPWERARWSNPPADASELAEQLDGVLATRFEALRGSAHPGVEVEFKPIRAIDDGKALIAFANEHEADLVVTGTTGRTVLGYLFLGTTAEKVMRDTECTVLAAR